MEHGDYNGTELFGVGTDRFIWLAYKPNGTNTVRLYSENCPEDGVVEFTLGQEPPPRDPSFADSWSRFPLGVSYILQNNGYPLTKVPLRAAAVQEQAGGGDGGAWPGLALRSQISFC